MRGVPRRARGSYSTGGMTGGILSLIECVHAMCMWCGEIRFGDIRTSSASYTENKNGWTRHNFAAGAGVGGRNKRLHEVMLGLCCTFTPQTVRFTPGGAIDVLWHLFGALALGSGRSAALHIARRFAIAGWSYPGAENRPANWRPGAVNRHNRENIAAVTKSSTKSSTAHGENFPQGSAIRAFEKANHLHRRVKTITKSAAATSATAPTAASAKAIPKSCRVRGAESTHRCFLDHV